MSLAQIIETEAAIIELLADQLGALSELLLMYMEAEEVEAVFRAHGSEAAQNLMDELLSELP